MRASPGWSLLVVIGTLAGCLAAPQPVAPAGLGGPGGDLPAARPALVAGFHDPAGLPALLDQLAAVHPGLGARFAIGQSVRGQPIEGLALTAPGDASGRARVLVDAGIHGNEDFSYESVLYLTAWLVENYGRNATATRVLANVDLRVLPMLSPDGIDDDTRPNANGVNLNRNFDVDFGNPSPLCRSQTLSPLVPIDYAGPRPLSEPESQALAAFMEDFRPQVYLSYHTGRHALIRPWSACSPPHPMPAADDAIFEAIETWVQNHTSYKNTGTADETAARERVWPPGAASGSSTDWCYLAFHCVALTPEVTLETREGGGDPLAWAEEVLPVGLHMLEHAPDYAAWRVPRGP